MTKKYQMPQHHDRGGNTRLEQQVNEIKQTTKETNKTVTDLSKDVVELKTLLKTGNEGRDILISHIGERSKENEERLDALEERVSSNESIFTKLKGKEDDHERRIGNLEGYFKWIVLLILGAVASGILSLVIK